MKIFSLLLILLLLLNGILLSQVFQTLEVEFERCFREKNTDEILKGTIYYQTSGKVIIVVTDPVNQWMIFEGKQLTIYYPDDKRAFQIITQNLVSLPFFQAFVGVIDEDYGLTELGYTLYNHIIKGDSLFTYWSPPKKVSKVLGDFTLVYVSDKIVYAEFKKKDGEIMSKSLYSNHIRHGANHFPLEISTTRYIGADSTFEKVLYSKPQFNTSLPLKVTNFKIPKDVQIKEIKW